MSTPTGGDDPNPPQNPWGLPPRRPGNGASGNGGSEPGSDDSGAGNPGAGNPGAGNPGAGNPGAGAGRREDTRAQGPRNPWGQGPGGNRPGALPPDLDEVIARGQAWLRGVIPGGRGPGNGRGGPRGRRPGWPSGNRGLALVAVGVVAFWLASGFYRVQPDEQGVVLRFGAFDRTTLPGLNYHLPWPIEAVELPTVTRINRIEIGYRSGTGNNTRLEQGQDARGRDVLQESLMLTGDENIIDIDFAVFWRIRDASAYLFATRNPDGTVGSVAESVMREVIGRTPIQPALTGARAQIETDVRAGAQAVLDSYGSGVEITQVQLQKVDPPADVIESFRDVQRANTDADRARNEAEATRNDIVPRARGEAAAITAAADAQRQAAIAESTGASERFLSVLKSYQTAKDVTLTRLYIETMQDVLAHSQTTVVDDRLKGVVPYLPLGTAAAPPLPPPLAAGKGAAK